MDARMLIALVLSLLPLQASAELRIFACEPEWAALAVELAPEAQVSSATTGRQDPHYVQARPSLISSLRRADLVVCTGAGLEVAWLPLLLRQAANPDLLPGRDGYLEAALLVERLEVPERLDRAEGDLHPEGNPHVQMDPRNILLVAEALAARLALLDPEGAEGYAARYQGFAARWTDAIRGWEQRAQALRGMRSVSHHRSWIYLNRWLGLEEAANLEPVPGIPPGTQHLASLLRTLEAEPVEVIIRSAYQDARASEWLASRSGAVAVVLPQTVGATDAAQDLFTWFDDLLNRLEAVR